MHPLVVLKREGGKSARLQREHTSNNHSQQLHLQTREEKHRLISCSEDLSPLMDDMSPS